MNRELLAHVVEDFMNLCDPGADPDLAAVQIAIMIEDLCGIRLTDDEIDFARLGHPDAIVETVTRHRGSV